MANTLANLARMYTSTVGQGTLTLTHAVPGFNTFTIAGVPNGATVTYALYEGPHREIGAGVYNSGNLTLTRATVYSSTNGGAKIGLAGSAEVFISPAAEDLASFATDLTAHLNDTNGAHAASAISFTPAGDIAATDVQAAIAELDSEKLSAAQADALFLTPAEGNAAYQPLDAELSALAGLTSAADKVPYFTGVGSASVADFTSVARTLLAQTTQALMRSTGLGLGTAATQNTSTSGTNVPLLDGANTWSAQQIISSASNISNLLAISTDAGASAGPFISVRRSSSSPATNDAIGVFNFQGNDSGGNNTNYGQLQADILDATDGSEDGQFSFNTVVAGTLTFRMKIAQGVWVGSPTGGDMGAGTLNAVGVYDDSVLLTCFGIEHGAKGSIDLAEWDALVPSLEEPAEFVFDEDEKGKIIPRKVKEARTVQRRHDLAHEFKAMLDGGFDPREPGQFFKRMMDDGALPGLPNKANWQHGRMSVGEMTNRQTLAMEMMAMTMKSMHEELQALKKQVGGARL